MQEKIKEKHNGLRTLVVISTLSVLVISMAFGIGGNKISNPETQVIPIVKKDSIASVKAFRQVYRVLMSPRCMNCHPSGDIPLQGDDSHIHEMFPKRGHEGKGILSMKCTNCHQPENTKGLHAPPGNANWHLPPADMKMVFEGKTASQLAKQLMDPKQNGNKNMKQLLEHADDGLVKWGWEPGEGRTLPPLTHSEFKKQWQLWLNTGAYAPKD
ncbi:hypothetical protein [Pedobacter metabolipauper]|uniref:Cytochrome c domain-containing protein n=1 Tax=Pedobacter metabolipauper TaxID=425513 RepID=A0A4V3D119_9SPHI|nr:hypothetical protein [Pedobacter metabolipauper]TDQ08704.1 hypothetical protein ATK78_3221 [Pedobacter metabolipauper]